MQQKFYFFIIFFLFLSNISMFAQNSKNILILNSYHRGFQWSDDVINGIEEVFYNTDINSTILYMDSKRINSQIYYKELKDLYKLQLKKRKYDLILTIDKFAYEFILENYSDLFTNEKIYFVGIEQFSLKKVEFYNLEKKVSGLIEKRAINDILKMIDTLIPSLKKLYIINDNSSNGDDSDLFIKNAIKDINKDIKIEYIRLSTLEELRNKFSQKKKNEAIFFVRFYNDKNGYLYKNSEIAKMINNSAIPVFTTDTLFVNKGSVGGKLVPIKDLGIQTGLNTIKIINNKIQTPYINTFLKYNYVFDYKKIKQFEINLEYLDEEYTFINIPLSFFDKHVDFMKSIFFTFPLLIFVIMGLIHNIYLRIKSAKDLKNRMEFDKVLLNAIESPILWQDKEGMLVDYNSKFEKLMFFPSPNKKYKNLKEYIEKNKSICILDLLDKYVSRTLNNIELKLKDLFNKEHIYLITQAAYEENVYKSSGIVTIFTDITSEREALDEKTKHQDFIIQQSKLAEIGEIFSSIAHQWKTPLVEIATIAQEQLYDVEGAVDETKSVYVQDTMIQVKYMTETINDFQNFIKPSNKKIVFDVSCAITKMLNIIEHNLKYNYISINVNIDKKAKLMVFGYRNEFMQTLLNIVNNAKDAILNIKKENFKGKIDINVKNINKYVEIEIKDNGYGIEEKNLPYIFDSYYTTKKDGHGIGLYMAKLIIEDKMNGKIEVKNIKDGVSFIIKLELNNENIST